MSELRQDLVSGDWVVIAPARAARPKFLDAKRPVRKPTPKSACPFEDLEASGNWPLVAAYPDERRWRIAVIANKYPAIERGAVCSVPFRQGIYHARTAVGTHRLLITRDHSRPFTALAPADAVRVLGVLRDMHIAAAHDECAAYVSSFYNYGPGAGASVWHPHYQILTLPIIPPHAAHSLRGANDYFKKFKRCVRCDIVTVERRKRTRVVGENAHAIAIAPYAAKHPFEVNILPKRHWASFRETPAETVEAAARLLQDVLRRMKRYLKDPDLNFFIHDTPLDGREYPHHHWHIEVVPRVSIDAGFEFSTGIEINVVDPDNAAAVLRGNAAAGAPRAGKKGAKHTP